MTELLLSVQIVGLIALMAAAFFDGEDAASAN